MWGLPQVNHNFRFFCVFYHSIIRPVLRTMPLGAYLVAKCFYSSAQDEYNFMKVKFTYNG